MSLERFVVRIVRATIPKWPNFADVWITMIYPNPFTFPLKSLQILEKFPVFNIFNSDSTCSTVIRPSRLCFTYKFRVVPHGWLMMIDCAQEQIPGVLFAHCHADEASDLIDDIGGSAGDAADGKPDEFTRRGRHQMWSISSSKMGVKHLGLSRQHRDLIWFDMI